MMQLHYRVDYWMSYGVFLFSLLFLPIAKAYFVSTLFLLSFGVVYLLVTHQFYKMRYFSLSATTKLALVFVSSLFYPVFDSLIYYYQRYYLQGVILQLKMNHFPLLVYGTNGNHKLWGRTGILGVMNKKGDVLIALFFEWVEDHWICRHISSNHTVAWVDNRLFLPPKSIWFWSSDEEDG